MSGLMGGQKAPTPQAPATMPDPMAPQIVEARRQAMAKLFSAGGRRSTIMQMPGSGGGGAPGGGSMDTFGAKTLGRSA